MSDKTDGCSKCGFPIDKRESGVREYGTHRAHPERRCHELQQAELTRLRAEVEREKKRRREIDDEAFGYSEQVAELRAEVARLEAEKAEAMNKIRAFRNYATGIIAQYEAGDYETRKANAEARCNEFEDALDTAIARSALRGDREDG